MSGLPALTRFTHKGPADLVAVRRWLAGDDTIRLTDADRLLAAHAGQALGLSQNDLCGRLNIPHDRFKALMSEPCPIPVDELL